MGYIESDTDTTGNLPTRIPPWDDLTAKALALAFLGGCFFMILIAWVVFWIVPGPLNRKDIVRKDVAVGSYSRRPPSVNVTGGATPEPPRYDFTMLFVRACSPSGTITITEAVENAKEVAARMHCGVMLEYNDQELLVWQKSDTAKVVDEYMKKIERKTKGR